MQIETPPPLLTTTEARDMLAEIGVHVSMPTLLNWCRDRGWGTRLPSGRWMVHRAKIDELTKETQNATTEATTDPAA